MHVQNTIGDVIYKLHEYLDYKYEGKDLYQLKLLIPSIFVAKLIGAKGCMIQEIASTSGGAVIRILADKKDNSRGEDETVVAIIGSQSVIFEAIKRVVEQIEYFKSGGPVLSTGKAIFMSITDQFKNSIILRNGKMGTSELNNVINTHNEYKNVKKPINEKEVRRRSRSFSAQKRANIKKERTDNYGQSFDRDSPTYYKSRERSFERYRERSRDRYQEKDKLYREKATVRDTRIEQHYQRERDDNRGYYQPQDMKPLNAKETSYNSYRSRYDNKDDYVRLHPALQEKELISASSLYEDNSQQQKVTSSILVPDYLVSLIIGKNRENVRNIANKSGSSISFAKEVSLIISNRRMIKRYISITF